MPGQERLGELHTLINKSRVLIWAVELMEEVPCPRKDGTIP